MDALRMREPIMTLHKRIALFFAVVTVGITEVAVVQGRSPVPAISPVEARLVIPDTKLLPGVPFELWIELRNPSHARVGVGLCAAMVVTPDGGEPFTVSPRGQEGEFRYPTMLPERDWDGRPVRYLVMRPGQTQTLTLPLLPELEGPAFFDDPRFSGPGRYQISMSLDYCWPYNSSSPRKSDLPPEFLGAVSTNAVAVERITPSGSAAAVWRRMQVVTDGKWFPTRWKREVIGDIISKYPDSNYVPYALIAGSFGPSRETYLHRVMNAVERFPQSPVVEMLQASLYGMTISSCEMRGDPMAAVCQRADKTLKASKRPTTRIRAFGREDVGPPPCHPNEDCVD